MGDSSSVGLAIAAAAALVVAVLLARPLGVLDLTLDLVVRVPLGLPAPNVVAAGAQGVAIAGVLGLLGRPERLVAALDAGRAGREPAAGDGHARHVLRHEPALREGER